VSTSDSTSEALAAAQAIIAAFGAHDVAGYFAGFTPEATFLFHTEDSLLGSRAAYERRWAEWEADGFRVLGCESLDPRVETVADGVAVFTHRVRTRLAGEDEVQRERETIVLVRQDDGRWLAVHEHLSPDPAGSSGE
jgi:ketosteroid isomerase-like protein